MLLAMAIFLGACFGAGCYFIGGSAELKRLDAQIREVKELRERNERMLHTLEGLPR